jgi:hypothetical protein
MSSEELRTYRIKRLDALVEKLGSNNELGRKLGMSNGTFIGQMRRGERPITEKFISKVETHIHGTKGWFDRNENSLMPPSYASESLPPYGSAKDALHSSITYLGRQLDGLEEYRRNAVGQLLLGLAKNPSDAESIASDIAALINKQGKMVA